MRNQFGQRMAAGDIADAITYIVTRPRHIAVHEMLIPPHRAGAVARRQPAGPRVIGVVVPGRSQIAVKVFPFRGLTVSSEMKPPLASGSTM